MSPVRKHLILRVVRSSRNPCHAGGSELGTTQGIFTQLFASVAESQTPPSVFIPFSSTTLAMHYLAVQDF